VSDPLDFSGQVAIVTGGCRGIGRGITTRFLGAGANVVICCRHAPDRLPSANDREAVFVDADVRDVDQIDTVVTTATERFGRLDILVNNAGGSPPADAATASPRFTAAIIDLNLTAPLNFAQRANAVMQSQDPGGSIVNISSLSGMRPSPTTAAYGAAKAGLINLTQTLAMEWAPKVRINCVSAGLIRTEQAHLHYGDESSIAAVAATVPLGRMGDSSDIADACLFLASPLARYVSGANLVVHGGGERPPYHEAISNTRGED
jgi:NAD(P)-dependent dehydrogenase (short-subunit alcohol dehydrogenase family)